MDLQVSNSNSQILIDAAHQLDIQVELIDSATTKLRLTKKGKQHILTSKSLGINPTSAINLSHDKHQVSSLLKSLDVSIPQEILITHFHQLSSTHLPPYPLVAKPTTGQKGHHVYVGIKDYTTLTTTLSDILNTYPSALVQHQIVGSDLRFLLLNHQILGLVRRHPPQLIADGTHTIKQLILLHNQQLVTQREKTHQRLQNRIHNWKRTTWHITNQGLSLDTILPKNTKLSPYPIANFQAGGTVETLNVDQIHPQIIDQIQHISRSVGLTICGIDMIIIDVNLPPKNNAFFIEINSDPSLRLHHLPNSGQPQQVAPQILKRIFTLH